jgi:hypothetical protein
MFPLDFSRDRIQLGTQFLHHFVGLFMLFPSKILNVGRKLLKITDISYKVRNLLNMTQLC